MMVTQGEDSKPKVLAGGCQYLVRRCWPGEASLPELLLSPEASIKGLTERHNGKPAQARPPMIWRMRS